MLPFGGKKRRQNSGTKEEGGSVFRWLKKKDGVRCGCDGKDVVEVVCQAI